MDKFFKVASKLGWKQVVKGIMVFKKDGKDGYVNINFVTEKSYDNFNLNDKRIDEEFVNNYLCKIGCCNKVKKSYLEWAIPLLISDYFGHRFNISEQVFWAKKAIKIKPELFPNAFSKYLLENGI